MFEPDTGGGLRDDLLLALAHDLRAPVSAIAGIATLVRDDPNLERADVERAAELVLSNAMALADLAEQLGTLRWTTPGRCVLEEVDLAKVVLGHLERLPAVAGRDVVPDLEPAPATVSPVLVGRIVENLVRNALTHAASGSVDVRVRSDGDGALLLVEDRGPGIAGDEREHVFDPFHRTPGAQSGWGVGLYLVRRLARAQGGDAWVEGRPGGGASFRARFPSGPDR